MSDYLLEILAIVNALANLSDVISINNFVMYAFGGLRDEYEQFIQNVTSRDMEVKFKAQQTMPASSEKVYI